MKHPHRLLIAFAALGSIAASSRAAAQSRDPYHAYFDRSLRAASAAPPLAVAARTATAVAHRDARSGVPTFVWALRDARNVLPFGASPELAARAHLARIRELYGVTSPALATARVRERHDLSRGGIVVAFEQAPGGVPLFQHGVKVLMRRDLSLVAVAGAPHPDAVDGAEQRVLAPIAREEAIAGALADLYGVAIPIDMLAPSGGDDPWTYFELAAGAADVRFDRPVRVRRVLFPLPGHVIAAYELELFARRRHATDTDAYRYVIAARDGRLLFRASLSRADAFAYRVWAEPSGDKRPLDGPIADFTPHPTGVPDGSFPAFVAPSLVTIDGFNGPADPWLAPGATTSRGNNVDAYTDHGNPDGFSNGDLRATTTSPGVFDRSYDPELSPLSSDDQSMAAVTQLFYVTNWLHDYWYDSGFDEIAGNAQKSNYGRGGVQGDPLLAEAQNGVLLGAKNNANMITPGDGWSPAMQVYLWDGRIEQTLDVTPVNQSLATGVAEFGSESFSLSADVALADDGNGTTSDACEPIENDVVGKIALVRRGVCTFEEKALAVQTAGAVGMILSNNVPSQLPPSMPGDGPGVTIGAVSITQEAGAAIEAALLDGSVSATMTRATSADVDGSIDNLVVAHEWGHYLHQRLVACALNQCGGEGEGWGDFLALTLAIRPSDDLGGVFSDTIYAPSATPDAAYFGTRRMPYSTDLSKNPLTFRHIQSSAELPTGQPMLDSFDNAEVHNTGEVWCSMLWEGYAALLGDTKGASPRYDFDAARRRMADYVVSGMKLAPPEPTFTEQRDAILAAALAADETDALLLANGFAKRGAGSCAVAPPKDSFDNEGVVESFTVAPAIELASITVDDSVLPCDEDGILDSEESGTVTIKLVNHGIVAAPSTTVTIGSTTGGISFPSGTERTLDDMEALSTQTVTFDVAASAAITAPTMFALKVAVTSPTACIPTLDAEQRVRIGYDNAVGSSPIETFESTVDVWTPDGDFADEIWQRTSDSATDDHAVHGRAVSYRSDTSLVSPELSVSATEPFVITFAHRHMFEASRSDSGDPLSPIVYWDGGVVEYSDNDGATWKDVRSLTEAGYGGTIGADAGNPLAGREGFVSENDGWPGFELVTLDFGTALAKKAVKIRFRIGTDQAVGDFGWEIDDVAFAGIEGTPFPSVVDDPKSCSPHEPVADAGPDQDVASGARVTLDGSGSADADGDVLTFAWTQTLGPAVVLSDAATASPTFPAPANAQLGTTLAFQLTVSDADGTSSDSVEIRVAPPAVASGPDFEGLSVAGGGCRCTAAGADDGDGVAAGLLIALGALARRRRRTVSTG